MSAWEPCIGASDEWRTPKWVFDALDVHFDLDVAAPEGQKTHVPARATFSRLEDGRTGPWFGFVWMNPPFGGRNGLAPWLDRFFEHANGVALTPDRTSAPWWQKAAKRANSVLFVTPKIQFERPDGSVGKAPGTGTTLFAAGPHGMQALRNAAKYGAGWLCCELFD